jgi:hypothetical protein
MVRWTGGEADVEVSDEFDVDPAPEAGDEAATRLATDASHSAASPSTEGDQPPSIHDEESTP